MSNSFDRLDIMAINSNPTLFGLYSGLSLYNLSVEISKIVPGKFQGLGIEFGLTLKTLPYTWLLLGMDCARGVSIPMSENDFSESSCGPQVGVNFIINNLNLVLK
ncbi:MAG: hypothetical protein JJE21_05250 [Spirochaetaceae bacterium]|nr:hypothetical protein [Spirochaetaceae bacterium]